MKWFQPITWYGGLMLLDLGWIHKELAPFYSNTGPPSIDPELMIKMLLVGYVFAIRSERRIRAEVQVNPIGGRRANHPAALQGESGLLLHRHCHVAVRRETNFVSFHVGHETTVDVVVMAFVPTLTTASLGQFDAVLFDPIDGADVNAVRANYFHMLSNTAHSGHSQCPAR